MPRDSINPAWSPDGKTILCVVNQPGDALTGLMAVNASNGQQRLIMSADSALANPTWLPEGRGVLVVDRGRASNFTQFQIAFVVYPEGRMEPVTRDTNNYSGLSVSANGQVLATVLSEDRWNLECDVWHVGRRVTRVRSAPRRPSPTFLGRMTGG